MTQATPLIRRVDRRNGRHYVVDGDPRVSGIELPSVTTVLGVINKPGLVGWARNVSLAKVRATLADSLDAEGRVMLHGAAGIEGLIKEARSRPDQVRDEAADFGTTAHLIISDLLEGYEPEVADEFNPVVTAFFEWQQSSGLHMTASERMVYSAEDRYAGALDIIATTTSGHQAVVDIKTSNGIWPEYALQVAAYAHAVGEMDGTPIDEGWVVRLSKTPPGEGESGFEARRIRDLNATYEAFASARRLWGALREPMWE